MLDGSLRGEALAQMRATLDQWAALISTTVPVDQVTDEHLVLPDRAIPMRRYVPKGADDSLLVWFHGGGYVSGSLAAIDPVCRWLADRAQLSVLSVSYRLAPEHPFPAALDDAVAVLAAQRSAVLAVGGDSAGGGLAAAAARLTDVPLSALVLLCPWLDATLSSRSVKEHGQEGLTEAALLSFALAYAGDADRSDPRMSPALGADLQGLPPAVVVTAGCDALRDEGEDYGARLAETGVAVAVRRWEGQEHGFAGQTADNPLARESLDWTADQLRALLDR